MRRQKRGLPGGGGAATQPEGLWVGWHLPGTGRRGQLHACSAAGLASSCPITAKCTPWTGRRPRPDLSILSTHTAAWLYPTASLGLIVLTFQRRWAECQADLGLLPGWREVSKSSPPRGSPGWARLEVGGPGPASVPEPPGVGVCSLQGRCQWPRTGWGTGLTVPSSTQGHRAQGQPR